MALIGLTGLVGLVGLLIDFTQVFDVVCQTLDHTGLPYGFGHVLVCCWVIAPVYPAGHAIVCVWVLTRQVGGFHTQVSRVICHGPQTGWPYGSGQVLWRVYVLLPVWFWRQASWRISWLGWQVGGSATQVLETLYQLPSTGVPVAVGQVVSFRQVSVPE